MRHDSQLDLGVVRGDDAVALGGDEGLANAPAFFRANRNVLQVRVRGRQAPRGGDRLVVGGVDAPRFGVDHARQLVGVGALQFGQAAVLQQQARQGVVQRQFLQDLFRRGWCTLGRLLEHRQFELGEQYFAELLG